MKSCDDPAYRLLHFKYDGISLPDFYYVFMRPFRRIDRNQWYMGHGSGWWKYDMKYWEHV